MTDYTKIKPTDPSPIHNIPYDQLDLAGWLYWEPTIRQWVKVTHMEYGVGITTQYLDKKPRRGNTYDYCLRIGKSIPWSPDHDASWINVIHIILAGSWYMESLVVSRHDNEPSAQTCAFAT